MTDILYTILMSIAAIIGSCLFTSFMLLGTSEYKFGDCVACYLAVFFQLALLFLAICVYIGKEQYDNAIIGICAGITAIIICVIKIRIDEKHWHRD